MDFNTDFNFVDEYFWSLGLISDDVYALLTKVCNNFEISKEYISENFTPTCAFVNTQLNKEITNFIDRYNVIGGVSLSSIQPNMGMFYHPFSFRFQTLSSLHLESNYASSTQQVVKLIYFVRQNSCDESLLLVLLIQNINFFISIDFVFSLSLCLQQPIEQKDICVIQNVQKYFNRNDV